jgi:hypothetical protein
MDLHLSRSPAAIFSKLDFCRDAVESLKWKVGGFKHFFYSKLAFKPVSGLNFVKYQGGGPFMKTKSFSLSLSVMILTVAQPILAPAAPACRDVLKTQISSWFVRDQEKAFDWNDPKGYLMAYQTNSNMGVVRSTFSKKWDTQIHYAANHGRDPMAPLETNLVDPQSEAVYLFVHGSGTVKSGGRNFIPLLNFLSSIGRSAVSIDMPKHANGPTADAYDSLDYTMKWFKGIYDDLRASGKKVILTGHSFGPEFIAEFTARYPMDVTDVVGLSFVGFNQELADYQDNVTMKMKFGGDTMESALGGVWAGTINKQYGFNNGKYADPTKVNPKLKMYFLSGDREEYVPGPTGGPNGLPTGKNTYDYVGAVKSIFSGAVVTVEPGIGHYIFDFKDKNGVNIVTRELLKPIGVDPMDLKPVLRTVADRRDAIPLSEKVAVMYDQDVIFKSWMIHVYIKGSADRFVSKVLKSGDEAQAKKILTTFAINKKERDKEIIQLILNTKETDPGFYKLYEKHMDEMKKTGSTTLFPAFLSYKYGIAITP